MTLARTLDTDAGRARRAADPLLANKVIVLTGGGAGIGRACAHAYAAEGATVAVVDRDAHTARAVCAELAAADTAHGVSGSAHEAYACDVGSGAAVDELVARVLATFGRIDVLHNNAGTAMPAKQIQDTTEDEYDEVFRVNLKSVYLTARAAFPALVAAAGNVINTASMVGLIGQADHAAYVATKGGMISLTKAMALDWAPHGVRVNAVCPASVMTPMLRGWLDALPNTEEAERAQGSLHALGWLPDGDVVADACVFLASERARFVTGCIMPVSGGAELGYRR
jgi:NAD(P)-dependent dehydrogenase (short-subunit alcohol dehydrogenase family)